MWFLDVFSPPRIAQSRFKHQISRPELPTFYSLFTLLDSDNGTAACDQRHISILQDIYEVLISVNDIDALNCSKEICLDSSNELWEVGLITEQVSFSQTADYIYESCRLSRLIWVCSSQKLTRKSSRMLQALKDMLERTDMTGYWLPLPGALLWCLLVGVDRALGNNTLYTWFASQLQRAWIALSIYRWQGLQRSLSCFGWLLRLGRGSRAVQ